MNKDRFRRICGALLRRLSVVWILACVDLKLRYHNSWAGFLWSFVKPTLQFFIYYIVFGLFLKVGSGVDYALAIFLGILTWSFFSESTTMALGTLVEKASIVSKVKVPNTSMPFSAYLMPLLNYLLGMMVFLPFYVLFSQDATYILTVKHLVIVVASLFQLSLIILAFNLMLSYLYVYFRDIKHFWEIIMIYGMLMSPVMYNPPIPDRYATLYYSVNVIAFPLKNLKSAFFIDIPGLWNQTPIVISSWLGTLVVIALALWVHYRFKFKVADYL